MEIVKAFTTNDIGIHVTISGTYDEPLFRASDIASVLEMTNIHASIKDFDDSLKVLNNVYTLGGKQEVMFLTEFGLYELLFRSRKPIAKIFKKWVCEVIKELRLTGQYKLEKENEQLKNDLEQANCTIEEVKQEMNDEIENITNACERNIVRTHNMVPLVYIASVAERLLKFGYTFDLKERRWTHRTEIGPQFLILMVFPTQKCIELEQMIKKHEKVKKRLTTATFNDKEQTEIIRYDPPGKGNFTLKTLENIIKKLLLDVEKDLQKENENLRKICKENNVPVPVTVYNPETELPRADPKKFKNVINGRSSGKIISRDLITGEEQLYNSINNVNSSVEAKAFKLRILDQQRQCDGKHWRSFGQPYWEPPMKFSFRNQFTGRFEGYIVATNPETNETVMYESPTEAAAINNWDESVRREINERLRRNKKTAYMGFVWTRLPRDNWGVMKYSPTDSEEENMETPKLELKIDTESTESKVKKLFKFTDSDLDIVTIKDLKWILKKHVPDATERGIAPYFLKWGAVKGEKTKKVKSIVDNIPGVYYKRVKYVGNLKDELVN